MQAAAYRVGMRSPAGTAETERRRPGVVIKILVVGSADNAINENHSAAAPGLVKRLPEGSIARGLAAAGGLADELEVLQESDEVVLTASGAGGH